MPNGLTLTLSLALVCAWWPPGPVVIVPRVVADDAPPPKAYGEFIFVPYHRSVDETVLTAYAQGWLPKSARPAWFLRVWDGKVQMKAGRDGKPAAWEDLTEDDVALKAKVVLGDDLCHYDGDGGYFLRKAVYEALKDRLVTNHLGLLETFLKAMPAPGKDGRRVLANDPANRVGYLWDEEDAVWRHPETLALVPRDTVLADGNKLYALKVNPDGPRRPLGALAAEWEKDLKGGKK